jgi:hypothetical protein
MLGDQEEEEPVNKIGLAATLPSGGRPMAMAMAMAMAKWRNVVSGSNQGASCQGIGRKYNQ